jgi:hypothetical protein
MAIRMFIMIMMMARPKALWKRNKTEKEKKKRIVCNLEQLKEKKEKKGCEWSQQVTR